MRAFRPTAPLWCIAWLLGAPTASLAQAADPAAQVIQRTLVTWMEDFNAGRADAACGLFAADLRYDYRGLPERGAAAMCDGLRRSLGDRTRKFRYALDIDEIVVAGDIAIVRLVWTLTVARVGEPGETTSRERGMDVFRREADGVWRIIRFLAYEEP